MNTLFCISSFASLIPGAKGSHIRQDSMEPGDLWDDVSNCRCGDRLKTLEQRARKQHQRCLAHSLVGTPNYIAPEVLLRKGRCLRHSPQAFHTPAHLEAILAPELWSQRASESLQPQISKTLNISIVTVYPRKHMSLPFWTALPVWQKTCPFMLVFAHSSFGKWETGWRYGHKRITAELVWQSYDRNNSEGHRDSFQLV